MVLVIMCAAGALALGVMQQRRIDKLREQLHYQHVRDRVGDLGLERELHQVRRRLAGLLASPATYLRAHRMLAPLELERDEITAELELIEMT